MDDFVYAFDLSMASSGVVIFDNKGNVKHITSIPTKDKDEHGVRLKTIADVILKLRDKYPTKTIIVERGFSRFPLATQAIYKVHGIICYLFADCEQIYYPPKKVKEVIVSGKATKKQVQEKINKIYIDIDFKNEDESDAFAVGLTYFIKNNIIDWNK